jgi:hypothetical protein
MFPMSNQACPWSTPRAGDGVRKDLLLVFQVYVINMIGKYKFRQLVNEFTSCPGGGKKMQLRDRPGVPGSACRADERG